MFTVRIYAPFEKVFHKKSAFRRLFDEIYSTTPRERKRRKEDFDNWLELEMNRGRWGRPEVFQTKTFDITLPEKTWQRIEELAKKYGMNVKLFISIIVEATANRFADLD